MMARLTLLLTVLTTLVALLGGFRYLMDTLQELRWRKKHTGKWFLIGCLSLLPTVSEAACTGSSPTWTAASASRTEVAACVTAASRNDTINVPAGSQTWTSSISITQGVHLMAAGVGNTIITLSGGGDLFSISPDATATANEEEIEIDGWEVDGGSSVSQISIAGPGASGTKPFKKLIIGHNKFKNGSTSTTNNGAITTTGQIRGVIYLNTFDKVNVVAKILGSDDTNEWSNSAYPQVLGTSDNLYFEDNTISYSSNSANSDPGWVESGQGGRVVFRYNTWDYTNEPNGQELWDIHGFQGWSGGAGGQTGTMVVEYYGNNIISTGGHYRWVNDRGGWALVFNNKVSGRDIGMGMNQMGVGSTTPLGCNSDVPGSFNGQVSNTYYFNNPSSTLADQPLGEGGGGGDYCGVAENTDYFNQASSSLNTAPCTTSACTSGIGRGTTAPTGTCTIGTAFWVASTASALTIGANESGTNRTINQAGHLYKCTATNTWTDYYTPYTYPHPLRSDAVSSTSSVVLFLNTLGWADLLPLAGIMWSLRKAIMGGILAGLMGVSTLLSLSWNTTKSISYQGAVVTLSTLNHLVEKAKR